jgi:hypothetical protein
LFVSCPTPISPLLKRQSSRAEGFDPLGHDSLADVAVRRSADYQWLVNDLTSSQAAIFFLPVVGQ